MTVRDLIIVGAGPTGLATAIAARQRGLDYEIVEKGVLVNSIYHFPTHMVFFTTPELYRAGARVTLIHRGARLADSIKYWVRPDIENRIKEGAIEARFETSVREIRPASLVVTRDGTTEEIPADAVLLMTGYHPDAALLGRAGVRVDAASGRPEYDPETLETHVPGLFVAGGVVSGKDTAPIFIENGRFHGETIVEVLAKRWKRS